jgi:hypothetical protein
LVRFESKYVSCTRQRTEIKRLDPRVTSSHAANGKWTRPRTSRYGAGRLSGSARVESSGMKPGVVRNATTVCAARAVFRFGRRSGRETRFRTKNSFGISRADAIIRRGRPGRIVLVEQLMLQRFTKPDSGLNYAVVQYRPVGEWTNLCVC